ncbi:MAG: PorT family protein [Marinilabiliaceae bacterium]|nr:PorT family protein [Marinilabiliaceae bacterium]
MKKKMFILAAVAMLASVASLQAQRLAFGLKAGYSSTQFTTDNLSIPTVSGIKDDAGNGYLVGAFARVKLFGDLSLQPELYYAKKKGEATYTFAAGTETQEIDINSWNIPLLAHFSLIDLKLLRVYAVTGPVVSILSSNTSVLLNQSYKESAKSSNWGYQLGGGVEVWKIGVDARYEWGLNNVAEGTDGVTFDRKSNMFTLALTYRIFGL